MRPTPGRALDRGVGGHWETQGWPWSGGHREGHGRLRGGHWLAQCGSWGWLRGVNGGLHWEGHGGAQGWP